MMHWTLVKGLHQIVPTHVEHTNDTLKEQYNTRMTLTVKYSV